MNRPGPQANKKQVNTPNVFPYKFIKRRIIEKTEPKTLHDELIDDHYDVAFEIKWTTQTATALNPCSDDSKPSSCPSANNNDSEYAGYNKRWLMTYDNRLAISPFTVKSAIANGFANMVGSCYRVISKVEGHPDSPTEGNYYYNGEYKRYRVSMGNSEPGIIQKIEDVSETAYGSKIKKIIIEPVNEYLFKQNEKFNTDDKYYGTVDPNNKNKKKVNILASVRKAERNIKIKEIPICYHGSYSFGMDIKLQPGDLNKDYQHRFYSVKNVKKDFTHSEFGALAKLVKTDNLITAEIDALNFETSEELKKKVYMGNFKLSPFGRDTRHNNVGGIWYEDLSTLKEGDWIYYQLFPNHPENKVENIGKNFQFKALFCHEDTVPEGFEECRDINRLCPRCKLFGMTGETYNKNTDNNNNETLEGNNDTVKALKGRFKASTLVSDIVLTPDTENSKIPFWGDNNDNFQQVSLNLWKGKVDENSPQTVICKQLLLPLQAGPKPNKRDVDGYFDKQTGDIKGSKIYMDDRQRFKKIGNAENYIKEKIDSNRSSKDNAFVYAHKLRRYAQVCDSNLNFTGVVGIENGDKDEIAALIMLLDTALGGHSFKVGLGKAFGMGAVESEINKVWIRSNQDYKWHQHEIHNQDGWTELKQKIGIAKEIEYFKRVTEEIKKQTLLEDNNQHLCYPEPGLQYWKKASVQVISLDSFQQSSPVVKVK